MAPLLLFSLHFVAILNFSFDFPSFFQAGVGLGEAESYKARNVSLCVVHFGLVPPFTDLIRSCVPCGTWQRIKKMVSTSSDSGARLA